MPKFAIRPETENDRAEVLRIIKIAFEQGDRGYGGEAKLVDLLWKTEEHIPALSLVGEVDGQIVGYIILSRIYVATEGSKIPSLILAPVAVHPNHQASGIGGALIQAAHDQARKMGEQHVFLLGHIAYYPRFGYQPSRAYDITFPEGRDDDHCMAIELVTGSLNEVVGVVEYSKSFYEI